LKDGGKIESSFPSMGMWERWGQWGPMGTDEKDEKISFSLSVVSVRRKKRCRLSDPVDPFEGEILFETLSSVG
jgi:hypothetical protein